MVVYTSAGAERTKHPTAGCSHGGVPVKPGGCGSVAMAMTDLVPFKASVGKSGPHLGVRLLIHQ